MTQFLISIDTDYKASVLELLKATRGVRLTQMPQADGTLRIEIKGKTLDDETNTLRVVEEIPGILDVRALMK